MTHVEVLSSDNGNVRLSRAISVSIIYAVYTCGYHVIFWRATEVVFVLCCIALGRRDRYYLGSLVLQLRAEALLYVYGTLHGPGVYSLYYVGHANIAV